MSFVRWLHEYDPADRPRLGGKNASLGELLAAGLPVPPGFAVTVDAYQTVREHGELRRAAGQLLADADVRDAAALEEISAAIRRRIEQVPVHEGVAQAVRRAYDELRERCSSAALPVAVRSSATVEDLPDASFAGEHDTFLWVRGADSVLRHVTHCWSSLFTARAIAYRRQTGHDHDVVAMSVGVQKVDPARRTAPSLTDEEVREVARLARRAEKHYGCPQDVEWAVDRDLPAEANVTLLQARPETVWSRASPAPRGQTTPSAPAVPGHSAPAPAGAARKGHWHGRPVPQPALIDEMEALRFEPLPDKEDLAVVTEGRGTGSGFELLQRYHRLVDLALQLWQYHFEFLNLGYAAYLDFFGFCKQAFPNIPDLGIAKMVAGVEVDLFQPDEELKKLARLAVDTGVDGPFEETSASAVIEALRAGEAGQAWLAQWEASAQPWFNFSAGSGFYHTDEVWLEHLEIPFGFIRDYIAKLRAGVDINRPIEAIRVERDRIVAEYSELLATDEDRAAFEQKLGLARVVFPYVENHNFYVEHWSHSVLWRKMRQIGSAFVKEGFFVDQDDVFLLKRDEVPETLWDMYSAWAVGVQPRGPRYWPRELDRRKRILAALKAWSPPPALGMPPEVVTEPFTIMLWGITGDSVGQWLGSSEGGDGGLKGFAASPGVAEGPARVIFSADQIGEVQEGEILVAPPPTAPSGSSRSTAPTGGPPLPTRSSKRPASAAATTVGCSASTEPASTSPPRWTGPPSRTG